MNYNAEAVPDLLGPNGPLSELLRPYEDRPYQREMALEVARLLEVGGILAVEAPTGIGKSLGYGLPAALWARAGFGPVVVSTYTKALQQQLLDTETPRLRGLVGDDLNVQVLKGRHNYLCRRRYEAACREATGDGTRALLDRLRPWVESTDLGDLADCGETKTRDLHFLSLRVASDAKFCAHRDCSPGTGCFYKQSRARAGAAHLLIVNHALLTIHLFDGGVLPAHDALIVDEAHALVPAALEFLSYRVGMASVARLRDLAPADAIPLLLREGEPNSWWQAFQRALTGVDQAAQSIFTQNSTPSSGTDNRRRYATASEFREMCPPGLEVLEHALGLLASDTASLQNAVARGADTEDPDRMAVEVMLERVASEVHGLRHHVDAVQHPERDEDAVHWREDDGDAGYSLCGSPVELGGRLAAAVKAGPDRVVFTSATLAAGQDFSFFGEQVGLAADMHGFSLPSPFDFESAVAVFAVTHGPDPRNPSWPLKTAEALDGLMRDPARNTMALFTSYKDLFAVDKVLRRMHGEAYALVAQSPGRSPSAILDAFRRRSPSLLLGTATFWQGIDLPGELLEVLAVTRLPFGVPTEPRMAARSERMESRGENPFLRLYVPDAVLRFKQGFGRLIRRRTDRGIVAVLDPRLLGKGYGRRFQEAIPAPVRPVRNGAELVQQAASWWRDPSMPVDDKETTS